MGGGDAYNAHFVEGQRIMAQSNIKMADTEGKYDLQVAQKQSEAVIKQAEMDYRSRIYESDARVSEARFDYNARIHEADTNKLVQMEALRVREKEALLQYKVDWKQAENDAVRAEGSRIAAEAKMTGAEAKMYGAETKRIREESRYEGYGRDGMESYWYG